jgi:hypothetical protein
VVALLGPVALGFGENGSGDPLIAGALSIDALFATGFLAFLMLHGNDA